MLLFLVTLESLNAGPGKVKRGNVSLVCLFYGAEYLHLQYLLHHSVRGEGGDQACSTHLFPRISVFPRQQSPVNPDKLTPLEVACFAEFYHDLASYLEKMELFPWPVFK